MDTARAIITVLALAAFALPAYAAWRTYRSTVAAVATADEQATEYERLYLEYRKASRRSPETLAHYRQRFAAIGYEPPSNVGMVAAPVHATARALRASLDGAARNAWLAILGLVCGAVAALWSLYLPPL